MHLGKLAPRSPALNQCLKGLAACSRKTAGNVVWHACLQSEAVPNRVLLAAGKWGMTEAREWLTGTD